MPVMGRLPPSTSAPMMGGRAFGRGQLAQDPVAKPPVDIPPLMAQLAGAVRACQQQATTIFYPQHREWAILHALYVGNQYATWSDTLRRMIQDSSVPKYRVRIVINVVMPVIQTMASMILKTRPQAVVVPASNENSDKNAARAAERILDYVNQDLDLPSLRLQICIVSLVKSACFAKVIWNPGAGPQLEAVDDDTGEPLTWPEGSPGAGTPMVNPGTGKPLKYQPGRVEVEMCYPEQVLVDPQARTWREVTWIVHTRRRDLNWIKGYFPKWGQWVTNERDDEYGTIEAQMNNLSAAGSLQAGLAPGTPTEGARVNELWLKPGSYFANKNWPKGARITQCQGFCELEPIDQLEAPGAELDRDWHPFVMARSIEGGRFWPISVVSNLAPIQREINRVTSNVIENQRLMARPKILIPHSCAIGANKLTSEPGEKVYYNNLGGGRPEIMAMPDLPAFVNQLIEYLLQMVDFVSNQHGPSRGQTPTNVRSGIGISLLQEQDATDLGPLTLNWESFEQQLGRQILLRVAQYWNVERIVSVVGKDKQIESFAFKGADIGHNIDVRVQAGSGLPKSKAAMQALVTSLVQLGLYSPMIPAQRRTLLQMMELGVGDDFGRTEEQDRRWAEAENDMLVNGIQSKVEWFEDHAAHIETHLQFMKGDEYRAAVAKNPVVAIAFQLHIAMHAQPQHMAMMGVNPANPVGPAAMMLSGGMAGAGLMGGGNGGPPGPGKGVSNGNRSPGMDGPQGQGANRKQSMSDGGDGEGSEGY
jgi:hypothetical protein